MISQKEKLVFGILYSLFALALVVCGIMNIVTGSWGLAVFVLGVSAFDIWQAIESFRYWFRYKEATKGCRTKVGVYDEAFEDIFDEDVNGDETLEN